MPIHNAQYLILPNRWHSHHLPQTTVAAQQFQWDLPMKCQYHELHKKPVHQAKFPKGIGYRYVGGIVTLRINIILISVHVTGSGLAIQVL